MKKKIAVYTVIFGNYDNLISIKHPESNIDYYCFTNNKNLSSDIWKIIYVNSVELNNRLLTKKYKILGSSELEKKYDIVFYIDGNIQIEMPCSKVIEQYCDFSKNSIFFLKHPERNCAYKEGKKCIDLNLDHPSIIKNQLKYYKIENFPEDYGLISTCIIIRKTKDTKLQKVLQEWYEQILKFSQEDQISIMYCFWKYSFSYGKIDLDTYNNSVFTFFTHEVKRKLNNECLFGSGITNYLGLVEEENKYEPEKENYHCKIEDENDSHSSIARKVKNKSVVLDIGCGVGIIGELLYKNKGCINYGIEIDKKSFKKAKESGYYKEVYNMSIENEKEYKELLSKKLKFDYIILADVLEHIKDPTSTLEKLIPLLNKKGKILISIPNIAYIDIIRALINREFNYQKTGILDSTHLRFFTRKSFAEMIDNFNSLHDINFDVNCFDCTRVNIEYSNNILSEVLNVDGEATVVQNIFELNQLSSSEIPVNLINLLRENEEKKYSIIERRLEQNKKEKDELLLDKQSLTEKIEQIELEKQSLSKITKQIELEKQLLNQQIEKINLDNNILNNELKKVFNSKSWKLTAPLRKIVKLLKK